MKNFYSTLERFGDRCVAAALHQFKMQQEVQTFYDSWVCTPARLLKQPLKKLQKGSKPFSVAIAHWNRGATIHRPLWNIINNEVVQEIVIVDDGSSAEQFELLEKNILQYDRRKVVRLYRREENRGALFTKMECVEKVKGDWVVLLDSDNTLFSAYLKAIGSLASWDQNVTYCPDWAFPLFCFHAFADKEIDFNQACGWSQEGRLQKISLMNDGNYFFHKKTYLEQFSILKTIHSDVADVMLLNYRWLSENKKLKVMPGASYLHRIDASSFFLRTKNDSQQRVKEIFARLENSLRWDESFEKSLFS